MTLHPLVRQILGAVIGASVAAGAYGVYTTTADLLSTGTDVLPADAPVAMAQADTGDSLLARIVDPLPPPAVPAPTPLPPPQFIAPTSSSSSSTASSSSSLRSSSSTAAIIQEIHTFVESHPPIAPRAAETAAPVASVTQATALPQSGPTDWLLIVGALGAAAGWHRRLLERSLAAVRQTLH